MKKNLNKQAIFQSFVFNSVILIVIIIIGIYFLLPEYKLSKENKAELILSSTAHQNIIKNGLTFDQFTGIHKTGASSYKGKDITLLNNILIDFREDDYNEHFTHTGAIYKTFIEKKVIEAKEKRTKQDMTNVTSSIDEILPEYTSDSSLTKKSLTDFKFVNYLEELLDTFQLSTKDKIGIGELVEIGKTTEAKGLVGVKKNPLNSIIYEGKINLNLIGEKRNIINFIYFIENVGKISVTDKEVSVYQPAKEKFITGEDGKRIRNNFLDMPKTLNNNTNIYNALIMEVDQLSLPEYLDSSDLPTPDGYDIIQLVKEGQADEKFQMKITLKYYVKGLPTFKIDKFISDVQLRYTQLTNIAANSFEYVSKNRSSLDDTNAIAAIGSLDNTNRYLLGLKKDLDEMRKLLVGKEDLGSLYKTAQELDAIFKIITKKLSTDLQAVGGSLYKQHEAILDKKNN